MSKYRKFIEDLAIQEVEFDKISEFVEEKYNIRYLEPDISIHCHEHFDVRAERHLRIALAREKMRQSDENFELGTTKIMNTVHTLNYLLENVMNRYRMLEAEWEKDQNKVKERDFISYIQQIRETSKIVHELNREIRNEDYIPKRIFQEECARLLQFVANILNKFDSQVPGHNLKDEFIMIASQEYGKSLEIVPPGTYIEMNLEDRGPNEQRRTSY